MSLSTVTKAPRWSPVTIHKINGPLGKNVVLHHWFIIILPLYALNNKNTPVASWARHVISALQSKCNSFNVKYNHYSILCTRTYYITLCAILNFKYDIFIQRAICTGYKFWSIVPQLPRNFYFFPISFLLEGPFQFGHFKCLKSRHWSGAAKSKRTKAIQPTESCHNWRLTKEHECTCSEWWHGPL